MRKISDKELIYASRKGLTIHQVTEKYGYPSDDILINIINSLGNSKALQKAFNKNQKAFERRAASDEESNVGVGVADVPRIEEIVSSSIHDTTEVTKITSCDTTDADENLQPEPTHGISHLAQLRQDEQTFSSLCVSYENEHKELCQQRRAIADELVKMRRSLEELLNAVETHQKNFEILYAKHEDISKKMLSKCQEISIVRELLDSLRKEICEARRASILFYGDSFDILNAEEIHIPDVSEVTVKENFDKLIILPEAENLTVKELRKLSELLGLTFALEKEGTKFDIEFDSEMSKILYETYAHPQGDVDDVA